MGVCLSVFLGCMRLGDSFQQSCHMLDKELCLSEVKQERITPTNNATTPEQSTPLLPSQQEFHQYLRLLIQSAVRTVIEAVMREELDALIDEWRSCPSGRCRPEDSHGKLEKDHERG